VGIVALLFLLVLGVVGTLLLEDHDAPRDDLEQPE
jgi:hypothetical protein